MLELFRFLQEIQININVSVLVLGILISTATTAVFAIGVWYAKSGNDKCL